MSYETVMAALKTQLAASAATRVVRRGLVLDPANLKAADLVKGVICLPALGGGNFWNYQGREGDGGDLDVTLVGFVSVGEKTATEAIEQAELALVEDVLTFCKSLGPGSQPLDAVIPVSFKLSGQLEHPFGWISMKLKVRWL